MRLILRGLIKLAEIKKCKNFERNRGKTVKFSEKITIIQI